MKVKDLFDGFIEYRAKSGLNLKTLNEDKRFLFGPVAKAVGHRELESLTLIDRVLLVEAGKAHGIFGSQRAVVEFRLLLSYVAQLGIKLPFHWKDLRVPKVADKETVEYLTTEEINRVRDCFDINDISGLRTRALIEFLFATGLRISEACSVDKKDINWESGEFRFINCKTKQSQVMFINEHALEWLRVYTSKRKDCDAALFVSGRARLLPVTSRNYIRQHVKKLNLGKTCAHHIFRRTSGTCLMQNGVDLKSVQTHMRHKSAKTTVQYYTGVDAVRTRKLTTETTNQFIPSPYAA